MTPEQRINELTRRQVFYGSSLVIKLNAVMGKWYYKVYAWINNSQVLVMPGKYSGQDPEILFKETLLDLGLKKIKLGVPLT